jgi:hypothetical protein
MTKKTQKPARPARSAKPAAPSKPAGKTYVVFGADERAKPRAARFSGDDLELLAKAVETMHLRLVEVSKPEVAELAAKLPLGRLHASGRGLVPYVRGDLYYELLASTLADQQPEANPEPPAKDLPRSWDEIAPGHLVITRETLECGWWEAVVIERTGDLVTVRYRDYPQYPAMVRHRSVVALISPPAP